MYIADVIPIKKGLGKETLTYFSSRLPTLGALVRVSIRGKNVYGIIASSKEVRENKAEIKKLPFGIKKIKQFSESNFILPEFSQAASEMAKYYAHFEGAFLYSVLPSNILNDLSKFKIPVISRIEKRAHEKLVVQGRDEERYAHYRSLIREEFAKNSSVFFCLPTIHDIGSSKTRLEKGIEKYTYVLHSSLSKKELLTAYKKILSEKHPVLIIATGLHVGIPRRDIGVFVVEKESSKNYKIIQKPYHDIRKFVKIYAEKMGARIIYGDLTLSSETIYQYKKGEYHELFPLKFRFLSTSSNQIIDMRSYRTTPKYYRYLSEEVRNLIKQNKDNNQRAFIFCPRRGLSTSTVCVDCGHILKCLNCDMQITLHEAKNSRFFLCHRCGTRADAERLCEKCGSWKLTALGIGIDKVLLEIENIFPDVKLFAIDRDHTTNFKRAMNSYSKFRETPGAVLVGTDMAMSLIDSPIENSAVVGLDSLFSIPDFEIPERIFVTLLKIRSLTSEKFLLQTNNPEQRVFKSVISGNLIDFYRTEIELREKFKYPPFVVLAKISVEGRREKIAAEMAGIKEIFKEYEFEIFPSFVKSKSGLSIMHALLRIKKDSWPDDVIVKKLLEIQPKASIRINPSSLL